MLKPFVLKHTIDQWPALSWTPDIIAQALADKPVRIRLGPKKHQPGTVLWETDSVFVEATLAQLLAWYRGSDEKGPFDDYSPKESWVYVDYKYMFQLFDGPAADKYLRDIDWGSAFGCGLENRDGVDSTFWMGTKGAYTPCHYDTYGFNLVAQLRGQKRWVLFPPTDDLGPTRLPYEESSVFSSSDFISPSSDRLCNTHPHVIILEPGDVLFVPPKWWHFVQSISDDFTISVNTWIDTPGPDREAKTMEALTQLLMAFMMKSESNDAQRYVIGDDRPAQIPEVETSLDILNAVLSSNSETVPEEDVVLNDFLKRWRPVGTEAQPMKDIDEFCHYMRRNCSLDVGDQEAERKPRKADKEDILKAMTHPDTVRVIFDQLMKLKN